MKQKQLSYDITMCLMSNNIGGMAMLFFLWFPPRDHDLHKIYCVCQVKWSTVFTRFYNAATDDPQPQQTIILHLITTDILEMKIFTIVSCMI